MKRIIVGVLGIVVASTITVYWRGIGVAPRVGTIDRLGVDDGVRLTPPLVASKVKVGTSTRDALKVPANGEFEATLPAGVGVLRFSVATTATQGSAEFEISADAGGKQETLFSTTDISANKWHDFQVDLDPWAGGILRFRAASSGAPSQRDLFWGSVQVLRFDADTGWAILGLGGRATKPNVILISLDTLRADQLSWFGNDPSVSPNIDRVLNASFSLRQAMSPYPNTLVSHASLLTGLYPTHHRTYDMEPLLRSDETLASLLRQAGYLTAAVTEDAYVGSAFGFDRGFDSYDDGAAEINNSFTGSAPVTFQKALAWLEKAPPAPFFLFVHTYEIHTPYRVHDDVAVAVMRALDPGYEGRFRDYYPGNLVEMLHNNRKVVVPDDELRHIRAVYNAGLNYTDRVFAGFLQAVENSAVGSETLIVLTSDHGEEFGEHGKLGHGETLHRQALHVPLAFYWPERIRPQDADAPIPLVDVLPTILELIGVPVPSGIDGLSIAGYIMEQPEQLPSRPAFAELDTIPFARERAERNECVPKGLPADCRVRRRAVQVGNFRLIHSRFPPFQLLYDLEHDPGEMNDISEDRPDVVEKLAALIAEYDSETGPPAALPRSSAPPVDEATQERLRALGYIE